MCMEMTSEKKVILIAAAFLLIMVIITFSCAKDNDVLIYDYNTNTGVQSVYPDVLFSVLSDTHIYDASLGSSGAAFEKALNSSRNLLLDSQDLLDYAIDEIIASKVNFVLICGDLTKDGELVNHKIVAEKLKKLKAADIDVYVVPGNHDINNPDAVRYDGDNTETVLSITANDFAHIYENFGYRSAITRDDNSLSYVAEPVEGLWLLAIDSCRYRENVPGGHEIASGKVSQKTINWITSVLRSAEDHNKAVIAMMHHGVVEHWKGQRKLHPNYLIQDYVGFGNYLASWNVRAVFTGHYHAQDITHSENNKKIIYDVETGSLVTAPCPVRYVDIKNNIMNIRTETIVDKIHPETDFASNAMSFVKETIKLEEASILKRFNMSESDIDIIADAVGDAFTAHYNGNENNFLQKKIEKDKLSLWGHFVLAQHKYIINGLWDDINPSDNNARIHF